MLRALIAKKQKMGSTFPYHKKYRTIFELKLVK